MTQALTIPRGFVAPAGRPEQTADAAAERAQRYANDARAERTRRAYDRAWQRFKGWAGLQDPVPLPVPLPLVESYLTHLADTLSLSSVNLAAAAIAEFHAVAGVELRLGDLWRTRLGIRNAKGVAARRKAPPLKTGHIARMLTICGPDLAGVRDRAILSLGFSAGLRRSEIAALQVGDVEIGRESMRLTIRRSKSDQAGQGAEIVIERTPSSEFCAVAALEAWFKAADLTRDALFRAVNRWGHLNHSPLSGEAIRLIVRNRAIEAGLKRDDFRAHSLRAGLATSAFDLGVSLVAVQKRLRHRNPSTTIGYDRRRAIDDAKDFRVLFSEFANDPTPARPMKADAPKAAIDDAELRELIRQAEEAQQRVIERLKQVGETK
jgi:integrase